MFPLLENFFEINEQKLDMIDNKIQEGGAISPEVFVPGNFGNIGTFGDIGHPPCTGAKKIRQYCPGPYIPLSHFG